MVTRDYGAPRTIGTKIRTYDDFKNLDLLNFVICVFESTLAHAFCLSQ